MVFTFYFFSDVHFFYLLIDLFIYSLYIYYTVLFICLSVLLCSQFAYYSYEPRSDRRDLLEIKVKSEIFTEKERSSCCESLQKFKEIFFTNNKRYERLN